MFKVKPWLQVGASVAAMSAAAPALAQETSSEIVVTAQRRAENLRDVPMSVDVATGQQLQELNLLDTKDISALAPGLELTNTTGRNNTTTLRGIGFDPDQGTGPTVQVYLNEVPTNAQYVYTAMYDIAQIEVLRGPQGLLRGLAAPAGAITIATARPTFDEFGGNIQASATDSDGRNVQAAVNIPVSDTFAIRVAGLWDESDGNQVRNVTNGDSSSSSTESARITLGIQPNDFFNVYINYQYLNSDVTQYQQVFGPGGTPGGVPSGPGAVSVEDRIAVSDGLARFQNESSLLSINANWNLGAVSLQGIASYYYTELTQDRDLDTTNAVPNYDQAQRVTTPSDVPTVELRLTSNSTGWFSWGLGAFYQHIGGTTVVNQPNHTFFFPTAFPSSFYLPIFVQTTVPIDSTTTSFNANARAEFDRLTIEGGVRYTIAEAERVAEILVSSPGNPGVPPFVPVIPAFEIAQEGVPASLRNQEDTPITGGLSVSYRLSDDHTAYASYGHSFRQGSVGVAVPVGISSDLVATDNEETDSFEIGLKGDLYSGRIRYSAAVFYQTIDGFLSRFDAYYNCSNLPPALGGVCGDGPLATPINNDTDSPATDGVFQFNYNGDATVKGVELSIDARPTDYWDIGLNLAFAQARYDGGARLPCNDFDGDGSPDADGAPRISGDGNVSFCRLERLSDTPDFSASATTELRLPTMGAFEPFVRGLVSYRPSVESQLNNFDYESRTLVNLYAGVRNDDSNWELSVFAKNLLDQERITSIASGNGVIGASALGNFDSGYRAITTMTPREIGVALRVDF
ncbi:MAG: TonB-dependent receptor [Hyphomonadaceae bacterium]|nr:TonB-dependent receptor [Hyphomonadaceae bacterium]